MRLLATFAVIFVAVLHIGFAVLETLFWQHPIGLDIFGIDAEAAAASATLAANQGAYNGLLALGLLYGLARRSGEVVSVLLLFVIGAGVFGALTVSPTIALVQALPAAVALAAWLAQSRAAPRG